MAEADLQFNLPADWRDADYLNQSSDTTQKLARIFDLHPITVNLLIKRGLSDEKAIRKFFKSKLESTT